METLTVIKKENKLEKCLKDFATSNNIFVTWCLSLNICDAEFKNVYFNSKVHQTKLHIQEIHCIHMQLQIVEASILLPHGYDYSIQIRCTITYSFDCYDFYICKGPPQTCKKSLFIVEEARVGNWIAVVTLGIERLTKH